ncbi:MAG: hypothetical protein SCH66_01655 [Methanolobus sp.]|nr:hypothetical protein [Methanolobus sp.]
MTSPPEFHYNGETMTLPIVKVNGNDSIGGSSDVNIKVKSSNTPVILYPNTTKNVNFTNPLNCNKILIYINSDFYDGWAEYAETLTSTKTALDHDNKTAIIEMNTRPRMGEFPLAYSFEISSLNYSNPEPIYNFSFFYESQHWNAANFNPTGSVITATSGTKTLVYGISKKNNSYVYLNAVNPYTSEAVMYTDSALGKSEVWKTDSSSGFAINEDTTPPKMEANATINLINNSYFLEYDSSNAAFSWGPSNSTSTTPDLYIVKGNANSTQSLNNITQHYMRLLAQDGTIEVTWQQKSNNKIVLDESTYNLTYDGGSSILTYMHITSNELDVTLE